MNILDLYLSKLPKEGKLDVFYLRPLEKIPLDPSLPWYASVPVGRDTLHKKLSTMCRQAGVQGHKTNHSLRVTSATRMYKIFQRKSSRNVQAIAPLNLHAVTRERVIYSIKLCQTSSQLEVLMLNHPPRLKQLIIQKPVTPECTNNILCTLHQLDFLSNI